MQTLVTTDPSFPKAWAALCARGSDEDEAPVREAAARVVADVRARGDAALLEYTARWDGWSPANAAALRLGPADFAAAYRALPAAGRRALKLAADRVRAFHAREPDA